MSQMDEQFIEKNIHDKLWDYLTNLHRDDCFARNWKGWTYRTSEGRDKSFFYREFDIARFHRIKRDHTTELWLHGYEVKGYTKKVETYYEPSFGHGIEQALVLLFQGADYAYVVIPEPKDNDYKNDLKEFCEKFARNIGLTFFTEHGTFWDFRKPERNIYATMDRKKKMLTSLITMPQLSEIISPVWARKHEY